MTKRSYPTVNFRVSDGMLEHLNVRLQSQQETRHAVAKRDLDRYYALLRQELRTVLLSRDEVSLLLDLPQHNGSLWTASTPPLLFEVMEDALRYGRAAARNLQGAELVERLKALSAAQNCALVDALERWWARPAHERTDATLLEVGLIQTLAEKPGAEKVFPEGVRPNNMNNQDDAWLSLIPPPSSHTVSAATRNEPALREYFGLLQARYLLLKSSGMETPWYDEKEIQAALELSGDEFAAAAYWSFFPMIGTMMRTADEATTRRALFLDQIDPTTWAWMGASAVERSRNGARPSQQAD